MTPLILLARLRDTCRFAPTVTNLQHKFPDRPLRFLDILRQEKNGSPRIISLSAAKELGNHWRFFTTYGKVQIGSVSRQPFPRTPDIECLIRRLPACIPAQRRCFKRLG